MREHVLMFVEALAVVAADDYGGVGRNALQHAPHDDIQIAQLGAVKVLPSLHKL